MYSRNAPGAFNDHLGSQHVQDPYKSHQPLPRCKVIVLKPLQEDPPSPVHACERLYPAICTDSDGASTSPLSFSPTSVLPQQQAQGAGNLFKALKQQTHKPAAIAPGASLQDTKQQVLGSWADNQVIHDLSSHGIAVRPLPGAFESTSTSGPIVLRPQIKPQQTKAPVINKRSTLDAAWHWRFKRQWGREQLKDCFPRHGNDDDDDDDEEGNDPWHDALHMIQAATTSAAADVPICDHDCYVDPSPSPLLDSDDLDGLLEDEPSPDDKAVLGGPEMLRSSSSRALAEAASKARELRKHQVNLRQRFLMCCTRPNFALCSLLQTQFMECVHHSMEPHCAVAWSRKCGWTWYTWRPDNM